MGKAEAKQTRFVSAARNIGNQLNPQEYPMSIRSIALGVALATVGTLSLAGITATSSEAHHLRHHRHHHIHGLRFVYGPAFYAATYAPCGWVWTRRGKFWYCSYD